MWVYGTNLIENIKWNDSNSPYDFLENLQMYVKSNKGQTFVSLEIEPYEPTSTTTKTLFISDEVFNKSTFMVQEIETN